MPSSLTILLLMLFILAVCLPGHGVYAFGAGNIPSYAYLEGKAFRHGDIEDALGEVAKKAGGGIFGAVLGSVGKSKFSGLDIKRIYFGNWLRDYSQAVDIAGLKKLPLQTIINLCMALGFLAHGYATHEFEVTEERLGVYLPTEHIDNPKGYGEGEDARTYDRRLRGPVDPRELEIDPRTGMKNYIANENGNWDTSKALVRRTLERCIHLGRQHRSSGQKQDLYEAYRLLGQSLHTLEDFTAHSNFCELALISLGHAHVFAQVGDQVRINAPNGKRVAPLITGTFGSADFIHSLLGEATDHISEASVTDLNRELDNASTRSRSGPGGSSTDTISVIRDLMGSIPFGDSDSGMTSSEMNRGFNDMERIRAGPAAGGKRPEDMSPQELHAVLWQVLTFRDSVVKKIEKTIEKIPGLGPLIEKLTDSISVFVFSTLEPYLKPILKTATSGLMAASGEVIEKEDQYEVFNNPMASDPTHSFLSKDHFSLILNEPAGKIAMIVVSYTAKRVVEAWGDNSINVHSLTEDILQCLFHPDFHDRSSTIQREMLQFMQEWIQGLGHQQQSVLQRLTKESVREHRNVRAGGDGKVASATSTSAYGYGQDAQNKLNNYVSGIPGVSQVQGLLNQVNRPNMGFGREGPGGSPGMGGSGASYRPPSGSVPMSVSSSGEAASYYSGGSTPGGGQFQSAGYNTPGGGRYESASYSKTSAFEPPAGPPPPASMSGSGVYAPAMGGHHHSSSGYNSSGGGGYGNDTRVDDNHARHGYTPSYGVPGGGAPSGFGGGHSSGGPAFPSPGYGGSSAPAFPGADLGRSAPSFPSADGPPGFPDAGQYVPPPGAPPGFPNPGPGHHGHHGHGHGHGHGHHSGNGGGGDGYYGGAPPGGYTRPPGPPGGW